MEGPWSVSLGALSWGEGGDQGPSENSWPTFQSPDKANGPSSFSIERTLEKGVPISLF